MKSNIKDCSVASKIDEKLYLNFDEEGYVNIMYEHPLMVMSLDQWVKLHNIVSKKEITLDDLLLDHFDARLGDE